MKSKDHHLSPSTETVMKDLNLIYQKQMKNEDRHLIISELMTKDKYSRLKKVTKFSYVYYSLACFIIIIKSIIIIAWAGYQKIHT